MSLSVVAGSPSIKRLAQAQRLLLAVALTLALLATGVPARGTAWLASSLEPGSSGSPAATSGPDGAAHAAEASLDRTAASLEVIVQARPGALGEAAEAVRRLGGAVGESLPLVHGFEATLPGPAVDRLAAEPSVRAVTGNHRVRFESVAYDDGGTASSFAKSAGATQAWSKGLLGDGVGVAVIDTGVSSMNDLVPRVAFGPDLSGEGTTVDSYGHGTVMAGIIAGSGADSAGRTGGAFTGVAPKAHVVSVKVAGRNGAADVSTMLQAMHWVSAYKDQFNIRVLNLSWGTPSKQDPRLDPLNFAVQRLWQQGIVVVVAAGNSGPSAGTITKPGDDPVVLTVGAYNENGNTDPADDTVPGWSSRGPTPHGVTKPDVIAPGRTLVATRSFGSYVEANYPKALISPSYIKGSGTSQAAAVTSGLVALLLQARPQLTPDQVKHLLRSTASPLALVDANTQGAGRTQLGAALTADAGPTAWQTPAATGLGSLETSRGGWNVETDCGEDGIIDVIKGEMLVECSPWDPAPWAGGAWTGGAWTGGAWTGGAWTGGAWTGGAWTDAVWSGGAWTGGAWTGGAWTGGAWTGGAWTGGAWTGGAWTGVSWSGGAWTGGAWTTAEYEETQFLDAFWGNRPPWWQQVAGEHSLPAPFGVR